MKMNCEIVRDLLPLYVDEICSTESRLLVEEHLQECSACGEILSAIYAKESHEKEEMKGKKFADGLKKLKIHNDKRVIIAAVSAAAALALAFIGAESLFVLPLKELAPEDVKIHAEVYTAETLPELDVEKLDGNLSVRISGEDGSEFTSVRIPSIPDVYFTMSKGILEEVPAFTVINLESNYHIRKMQWRYDNADSGIVYLNSMRTSVFNNQAHDDVRATSFIEMAAIRKIIYVGEDGKETVLWEQAEVDHAQEAQQTIE